MAREQAKAPGAFRIGLGTGLALSLAAIGVLLWRALPYYVTPLAERAHRPDYWQWKPGGTIGHPLGWIGSAMMVAMLGYSLRKRVRFLRGLGALSHWLDGHIVLGIVGPLLIVLHTSFKVHGLVALSFWSMIIVALSGVVGRYLYLQIPRSRAGEALTLADLEAADRDLSLRMRGELGLSAEALAAIDRAAEPASGDRLLDLMSILMSGRSLRRRVAALGRFGVPPELEQAFHHLAQQKAQAHWRLRVLDRLQRAFHYWHVLHKPLAVVMYVFMLVHVGVAWATGYGGVGLP